MTVETGSYDKPAGKLGDKAYCSVVEHDGRRRGRRQAESGREGSHDGW